MVESTLRTIDPNLPFKAVNASRGKAVRAEPIAAMYEQGKIHHVGRLDGLENEMITWQPGVSSWSPNRIDALVWVLTELMLGEGALLPAGGMRPPDDAFTRPRMRGFMTEADRRPLFDHSFDDSFWKRVLG